jgi:hypothetical protein
MTFLAALRRDRVEAPWLRDGPINGEQLFAKLKHHLQQAQARSQDAVCHAIAKVLETVTAPECSNCFAHAGYGPT